jgi:translation initiation factor IF-2
MPKKHSHQTASEAGGNVPHSGPSRGMEGAGPKRLEIVLKCDSPGSIEAVMSVLSALKVPDVEIVVIHSAVGPVSKSDLLMALTCSKFVVGFNVEVMPKLDQWIKDRGAEVRTYNVIYKLAEDLKKIAQSLIPPKEEEEKVTGRAEVIALFKSSHRGIILGCEVREGTLVTGKDFRVITVMGPAYFGKIESLQVDRKPIKEAKVGQQVGLKISDFSRAKIGDQVECFERAPRRRSLAWQPSGNIIHLDA